MLTPSAPIRILIVEDRALTREGLIAILESYRDMEVVGAVGNSQEALHAAAELEPDTILLSGIVSGDNLTALVQEIRNILPRVRLLVIGEHDIPEVVRNLLELGVSGYLLQSATKHQLVGAIRGVHADDGGVALFVSRQSFSGIRDGSAMLSARERDVLELVARALSNAQVAAQLSVTEATVKRHLRNVFVKLGAVSRIDAVNKAVAAAQIVPRWPAEGAPRLSSQPGEAGEANAQHRSAYRTEHLWSVPSVTAAGCRAVGAFPRSCHVSNQLPHERVLGFQEQSAVLGVEPPQPGNALRLGETYRGAGAPDLVLQTLGALFEQPERLAWGQRGHQPESNPERRGLICRITQDSDQPLAHLGAAILGDRVHGPLRPPPLAGHVLCGDEALPSQ